MPYAVGYVPLVKTLLVGYSTDVVRVDELVGVECVSALEPSVYWVSVIASLE